MSQHLPPTIDPLAATRWAAMPAQASAWLHEEVARRMAERLQWIKLQPASWVHWEPVRGGLQIHRELVEKYPNSTCFVLETVYSKQLIAIKYIAKPWWNISRWVAGATRFEVPPDASVDMLWANMALHQSADPKALMMQWHRLLATDGFLMFSCLGPDTLKELRALYRSQGWPEPAHIFTDMHDWGDMLLEAGFAEPVMDMERITLSFNSPTRLIQELRQLGRNLHLQRYAGLRTRQWLTQLHKAIECQSDSSGKPSDSADGQHELTFEIIYGHAFKPPQRFGVQAQTQISVDAMRASLRDAGNRR